MSASSQEGASSTPGTFGRGEDGPWDEDIDGYEDSSFERLVDLVDGLAPHLLHSFICLRRWWKERRGAPEAHVSFRFKPNLGNFSQDDLSDAEIYAVPSSLDRDRSVRRYRSTATRCVQTGVQRLQQASDTGMEQLPKLF